MPKQAKPLSARAVQAIKEPGRYAVGLVDGLHLRVTPNGAKSWVLRVMVGERRCDVGLGSYPFVTLEKAREDAYEYRKMIREGIDPVAARKAAKATLSRAKQEQMTFETAARNCHAVKASEYKNKKHSDQWLTTLVNYAFPAIGDRPVAEIETPEILAVLEPIWLTKPETASRVRQRLASVFDWSIAAKIRTSSNPAAWNGCLEPLLPAIEKVRKKRGGRRHFPALPVNEVPRLMADLTTRNRVSAHALRFAILTATRSNETRLATWDEFDFERREWTLGPNRMKSGKKHIVPLSDAAIDILQGMPRYCQWVFPSSSQKPLSDMALSKLLKDVHAADVARGGIGYLDPEQDRVATPHGTARSSFKDWSREGARYPDEWSELALAHVNNDTTRAAYARNALLEERRVMMEAWGRFSCGLE